MSQAIPLLTSAEPTSDEIRLLRPILREAERRAERVVAWARLIIVVGFLAVTAVTVRLDFLPAGEAIPGQILIALGTIAVGGLLSIISLILTHPRRFRRWMSWGFAFIDLGFCVGSLALTLVNVGLPGSYLAVAPASWLIVLALTFSLMRINPRIQAVIGFTCVASLIWLWTWPGQPVPGDARALLQPVPNLVRLMTIAFAAMLFVWIAARVRFIAVRGLSEGRRNANLTRFLPRQIAGEVESSGSGGLEPREIDATVMFVDIRGFTAATRNAPPRDVANLLTRFRAAVIDVVDARNGVVDKFIGDGALLVFGFNGAGMGGSIDAVEAAADLIRRIEAWNRQRLNDGATALRIGIGLHRGPVLAGTFGDERRLEFTVLGDTVNIASRLESHTKASKMPIVLSAAVAADLPRELAANLVHLKGAPPRDVPAELTLFTLADHAIGTADAPRV